MSEIELYCADGFVVLQSGSRYELQVYAADGRLTASRLFDELADALADMERRRARRDLPPARIPEHTQEIAAAHPVSKKSKPKGRTKGARKRTAQSAVDHGKPLVMEQIGPLALIRKRYGGYCVCLKSDDGMRLAVQDFLTANGAQKNFQLRSEPGDHVVRRLGGHVLRYEIRKTRPAKALTLYVDESVEEGVKTHAFGSDVCLALAHFERISPTNDANTPARPTSGKLPPQTVQGLRGARSRSGVLGVVGSVGNRISHDEIAHAEEMKRLLSGPVKVRRLADSDQSGALKAERLTCCV